MNIKIEKIFIFNPNNLPEDKKATEEEYIKAKNEYFFPNDTNINSQTNLIGYSEGIILFFNKFKKENSKKNKDFYVFNLGKKYHIIKIYEKEYYLNIVFDYIEDIKIKKLKNNYNFVTEKSNLEDNYLEKMMNTFYELFIFYNGYFSNYFKKEKSLKIEFIELMTNFINKFFSNKDNEFIFNLNYIIFNNLKRKKIKQNEFLKLSFIYNKLKSIENNFSDIIIYFNNNFLFSSLEYKENIIINYSLFGKNNLEIDFFKNFDISNNFEYKSLEIDGNGIIIGNKKLEKCWVKINNKFEEKFISCLYNNGFIIVYLWNKNDIVNEIYETTINDLNELNLNIIKPSSNKNFFFNTKINFDFMFYNYETFSYSKISKIYDFFGLYDLIIKNSIINFLNNKNRVLKIELKNINILIKFINNRYLIILSKDISKEEFETENLKIMNNFKEILI